MANHQDAVMFAIQEFEFKKIYLASIFELPHLVHIPDNSKIMGMLEKAARDPDYCDGYAFDRLTAMVGDILRRGGFFYDKDGKKVAMYDWLSSFAAEVLEGKRTRPSRRGPDRYRNFFRDLALASTVDAVAIKFDLPRYTNNELSNKPTAAEIVAEAAGLKVDVVIMVYKNLNKRGK